MISRPDPQRIYLEFTWSLNFPQGVVVGELAPISDVTHTCSMKRFETKRRVPYTFCVKREWVFLCFRETWFKILFLRDLWSLMKKSFFRDREGRVELNVIRESSRLTGINFCWVNVHFSFQHCLWLLKAFDEIKHHFTCKTFLTANFKMSVTA